MLLRFSPFCLAALLPLVSATRAPGDTRPNIIIFFPDTARASDWGVSGYDHPFVQTPHAAALAAGGATFLQAHAQHTQCSPSRCALFSGRYLRGRGHRTQNHLLQASEDNVFAALKAVGYTTLHLGKNDVLAADAFNRTFSYWEGETGVAEGGNAFPFGEAGYYSFLSKPSPFNGSDPSRNGDLLAIDRVSAWLASGPPEPFAIWLPGVGAHPPYSAPADYYNMYSPAQVAAQAPLRRALPGSNKPLHLQPAVGIPRFRNLTAFNDSFFEKIAAVYLGRVSYIDFLLGRLMAGIDAAGAAGAQTALIFTSDHGDYAGDYHAVEKYPCALDDMLTRVPLIARVPGGAPGVRVAAPVQTLDLFATLLDLARVNASTLDRTHSVSLLPAIMGAVPASSWAPRPYASSDAGYVPGTKEVEPLDPAQAALYADVRNMYWPRGVEELTPGHCDRAVMLKNATAKIVYRVSGVSELYDLVNDPLELMNRWGEPAHAALQAALTADLLAFLVSTADVTPLFEDDRGLPPSGTPPFPWPPAPLPA